jgi:hypothetical protein
MRCSYSGLIRSIRLYPWQGFALFLISGYQRKSAAKGFCFADHPITRDHQIFPAALAILRSKE